MSRFLLVSVVLSVLFAVALAGGGHGFGGYQQAILVQPVVAPVAVQPVMMQAKQRQYVQPVVQQQKRVNYAQPIVTYAQPIVQAVRQAHAGTRAARHTVTHCAQREPSGGARSLRPLLTVCCPVLPCVCFVCAVRCSA